jgi:hypothetical protein
MQMLKSELYYELSTPIGPEKINETVYLNFIENSNLDYTTSVKKGGKLFLPFLLYYYTRDRFDIKLGERSLIQTYREFLTDALLVECNRSTCFILRENNGRIPKESYTLAVRIDQNNTSATLEFNNSYLILPLPHSTFDFDFTNYKIKKTNSDLKITVCLAQQGKQLLEKTYFVSQKIENSNNLHDNPYVNCMDKMVECLSACTKEIVEEISRDLNFVMHHANSI